MTEWVEQRISIKFCIKLEHSSVETIWMIQKAAAMGSWWLAASSWQHTHSSIMSRAEFLDKSSNHPGDSAPLQPRSGTMWLLASPKTKITLEREEISGGWWDSGKYDQAADGDWENCVRFQGAYCEGNWGIVVLYSVFLVSRIFFSECLYFSHYMAGYLLDRPPISASASPGNLLDMQILHLYPGFAESESLGVGSAQKPLFAASPPGLSPPGQFGHRVGFENPWTRD